MHNQGYPLGCARRGGSGPPQKGRFLTPKWGFFDPQGPPPKGGYPPPGVRGGVFSLVLGGYTPPLDPLFGGSGPPMGGFGGKFGPFGGPGPPPGGAYPPIWGVWGAFCLANPVPSYGNIGQFWPFWGPGGASLGPGTPPRGGPTPRFGGFGGYFA